MGVDIFSWDGADSARDRRGIAQRREVQDTNLWARPCSLLQTLQDGGTHNHWFGDVYLQELAYMLVSAECSIRLQALLHEAFLQVPHPSVRQMPQATPLFPLMYTQILGTQAGS